MMMVPLIAAGDSVPRRPAGLLTGRCLASSAAPLRYTARLPPTAPLFYGGKDLPGIIVCPREWAHLGGYRDKHCARMRATFTSSRYLHLHITAL